MSALGFFRCSPVSSPLTLKDATQIVLTMNHLDERSSRNFGSLHSSWISAVWGFIGHIIGTEIGKLWLSRPFGAFNCADCIIMYGRSTSRTEIGEALFTELCWSLNLPHIELHTYKVCMNVKVGNSFKPSYSRLLILRLSPSVAHCRWRCYSDSVRRFSSRTSPHRIYVRPRSDFWLHFVAFH